MQSASELIKNYSIVGDAFLITLCLIMLVIVKLNYMQVDTKYKLMVGAICCLIVSAASNIAFSYVAKFEMSDCYIYIFRSIYHCTLLLMFVFYVAYICSLINVSEKENIIMVRIALLIFIGCTIWDITSPWSKFGLYRDAEGFWHDDSYLKGFTIGYGINIAYMCIIIMKYHKLMLKRVVKLLAITSAICVIVDILENIIDSNSFLALTFVLPVLVVMVEFHANAVNTSTGTRDFSVLSYYISDRKKKNKKTTFMYLSLNLGESMSMPISLAKLFYGFYCNAFRHAELYSRDMATYVLAIPDEKEINIEEKVNKLVYEVFPEHYKKFQIKYKIINSYSTEFDTLEKYQYMLGYYLEQMEDNSVKVIDIEEMAVYNRKLQILAQLQDIDKKRDLDDERILVYCQPVKNVATQDFDTAEALMRIKLPDLGMIYPDVFIPLAERHGIIHILSLIILNKTCKSVKQILDEGYKLSRVSVNFSISELTDDNFISDFKKIIEDNGIDFRKIGVELTESQNDKDYETVSGIVKQLKEFNTFLYLDDFGTGYSNFDRILKLQFDVIKMDRSLLLLSDTKDSMDDMLSCFSNAFDSMGYRILYEGVENDGHEEKCTNYKADYLQGYKYSKPIPIDELRNFLSKE